jgi:hypothetical protein
MGATMAGCLASFGDRIGDSLYAGPSTRKVRSRFLDFETVSGPSVKTFALLIRGELESAERGGIVETGKDSSSRIAGGEEELSERGEMGGFATGKPGGDIWLLTDGYGSNEG